MIRMFKKMWRGMFFKPPTIGDIYLFDDPENLFRIEVIGIARRVVNYQYRSNYHINFLPVRMFNSIYKKQRV